ncbi:MAG: hypothetical protein A3G33_01475 [Omnitrophica bacterium RIFCSPLOWO2_12_FULL_44_17]|uniref:MEMO1 family protein A3G33_01475 n=1 Tax=Candidatus Danuiimicrobium aquiferis TaxID=1801832 RepID=A0A1G1KV29_9BACT|nr:MAG: hypothetical protein A3B72_00705 [Omnitrophica bacterium RIFCSPHIGHO2_02_FULL_45_28]OGW88677.1 MAG: hypothetical protein A3E74_00870 [Omnitrophica bacterium RIFCSPHIGHO2_12_FULL_44_12]OGW96786.1 MAG: hypothetical protein A3G33_01475 [Omnitrophica bacterium RIFCSPLOWO2_12_FULL_44_17]OGX03788.1 MAG: hypothetical protein A3J12_09360 [Omnitrophica bacterium RIFCSPLOWO2_02_FULL_44_11]
MKRFFWTVAILGISFIILFVMSPLNRAQAQENVRKAVVSGQFYPGQAATLKKLIADYFSKITVAPDPAIKSIIVPHAGYPYSGPVAAYAYKAIQGLEVETVIIVGFSHRTPLREIYVDDHDAYETPLGKVPINRPIANEIRAFHPALQDKPRGEMTEHSIEVQVPFLQESIKKLSIVLVYFGDQSYENAQILADALTKVVEKHRVLIVISTDLSHFHEDAEARKLDHQLIALVKDADPKKLFMADMSRQVEACGIGPLITALMLQEKMGWAKPELIHYANSSDVTGDKTSVVGYATFAITGSAEKKPSANNAEIKSESQQKSDLTRDEKKKLLQYVRAVLESHFDKTKPAPAIGVKSPVLDESRGVFVTLKENGNLRGCIGQIVTDVPILKNLKEMALSAALHDPRFPPVKQTELKDIDIHVSLLTIPKPIGSYKDIRLGIDGIVVRNGYKGGVFLPEVATETGWNQETFFRHCAIDKAGMNEKELANAQISAFQTDSFGEKD